MAINDIEKEKTVSIICVYKVFRGAIDTFQAIYFGDLLCFIIVQTAVS